MAGKDKNSEGKYIFVLYIDLTAPDANKVIDRLRQLCHDHLIGSYSLDVVDVCKNPEVLEQRRIIALPALDVFTSHGKKHRFIGDLSLSKSFIIAVGMRQSADKMGKEALKMGENAARMGKDAEKMLEDE
jgi:circadian clock protein KaiB